MSCEASRPHTIVRDHHANCAGAELAADRRRILAGVRRTLVRLVAHAKTSGELAAPVGKNVRDIRDARGVPHITVASIEDAFFAQGFATAQDRLWQMDMLRRTAAGELSEVAGKAALESDIKSRKLRMRSIAEAWTQAMPPKDRAWVAAYARGVNHFIETNRGKWGPEFRMMGYEPRPWTMLDSMLCALHMNRTLSGNYEQDLLKRRMIAAAKDKAKVEFLFPIRSGDEPMPGSNSWPSPEHTVSGKPPRQRSALAWFLPSTWYGALARLASTCRRDLAGHRRL